MTSSKDSGDLQHDHIHNAYKFWAPLYDTVYGLLFSWGRKAAVEAVNKAAPATLLEVGVGTGLALPNYNPTTFVTGIDLSEEMLTVAKTRVEKEGLKNIKSLTTMDAAALTFEDNTFECAVSMFVITIAPDPEGVMREMIRVVKPGGRIILLNHFKKGTGLTGLLERITAKHVAKFGWRPDFDKTRITTLEGITLLRETTTPPIDFYTVLEFEVTK